MFSVKGQIISILSPTYPTISVTRIHLCPCMVKTALNTIKMNEQGCVTNRTLFIDTNLNSASFSCVTEYYSLDLFQLFEKVSITLSRKTVKNKGLAGLDQLTPGVSFQGLGFFHSIPPSHSLEMEL